MFFDDFFKIQKGAAHTHSSAENTSQDMFSRVSCMVCHNLTVLGPSDTCIYTQTSCSIHMNFDDFSKIQKGAARTHSSAVETKQDMLSRVSCMVCHTLKVFVQRCLHVTTRTQSLPLSLYLFSISLFIFIFLSLSLSHTLFCSLSLCVSRISLSLSLLTLSLSLSHTHTHNTHTHKNTQCARKYASSGLKLGMIIDALDQVMCICMLWRA